jgi:hypothetical protein
LLLLWVAGAAIVVGIYEGNLAWARHTVRLMTPSIPPTMRQAILDQDRAREIDSGYVAAMQADPTNQRLKAEWEQRLDRRRPRSARADSLMRSLIAAHPADTAYTPGRSFSGQTILTLFVTALLLRVSLGLMFAVPFTLVALTLWWLVRVRRNPPRSQPA